MNIELDEVVVMDISDDALEQAADSAGGQPVTRGGSSTCSGTPPWC
jgi:hypothetical protein